MKPKIQSILKISPEELEKLSDKELEKLLGPFIPPSRLPNKQDGKDAVQHALELLQKLMPK